MPVFRTTEHFRTTGYVDAPSYQPMTGQDVKYGGKFTARSSTWQCEYCRRKNTSSHGNCQGCGAPPPVEDHNEPNRS